MSCLCGCAQVAPDLQLPDSPVRFVCAEGGAVYSMVQPFTPYGFNRRFLNIRSVALHTFGVKVTFHPTSAYSSALKEKDVLDGCDVIDQGQK